MKERVKNLFTSLNAKGWPPDLLAQNAFLHYFAWTKIPLIGFLGPKVIKLTDQEVIIKIPLGYRSKNHWGSMYFGALAVGADLCVGLMAFDKIRKTKKNISLIFKDFSAQFHRRATRDVYFVCDRGGDVDSLIKSAAESEERVEKAISGKAYDHMNECTDPVATFTLTLSLKQKS